MSSEGLETRSALADQTLSSGANVAVNMNCTNDKLTETFASPTLRHMLTQYMDLDRPSPICEVNNRGGETNVRTDDSSCVNTAEGGPMQKQINSSSKDMGMVDIHKAVNDFVTGTAGGPATNLSFLKSEFDDAALSESIQPHTISSEMSISDRFHTLEPLPMNRSKTLDDINHIETYKDSVHKVKRFYAVESRVLQNHSESSIGPYDDTSSNAALNMPLSLEGIQTHEYSTGNSDVYNRAGSMGSATLPNHSYSESSNCGSNIDNKESRRKKTMLPKKHTNNTRDKTSHDIKGTQVQSHSNKIANKTTKRKRNSCMFELYEQLGLRRPDSVDNTEVDKHCISNGLIYKCNICRMTKTRLDKMRAHIRSHLKIRPFVCNIDDCKKTYTAMDHLQNHVRSFHKPGLYPCLVCGKVLHREDFLKQHHNIHNGIKPYKCKKCKKCFHLNTQLTYHMKFKHLGAKHVTQCEICGKVGKHLQIKRHIEMKHMKNKFQCKQCDSNFKRSDLRKDHIRIVHNGGELYKCDLCSKTYEIKRNIAAHIKNSHSLTAKVVHTCTVCGKVFRNKVFYDGHVLEHEGVKRFPCKVCGARFAHGHYLHSHMKSHGERRFTCDICGGKFNRKDNLKTHIIRHQTTSKKNLKKT